jgi:hypothetical protein
MKYRRWVVEINPMGLGHWQPTFFHWFKWAAERRAKRVSKTYACECRVRRERKSPWAI